jgi:molybdate transport system substrate-binding protein
VFSRISGIVALVLVLTAAACGGGGAAPAGPVVFAAASLQDVVAELAAEFERQEEVPIELNLAGSNTLAQQILAARGADVFLSADLYWVEVLESAGRVVAGSRRPLLGNRLVLIAANRTEVRVGRPEELAGADFRFLALADPEAVPAGRYAKATLEEVPLGGGTLWQAVAARVAPTLDVRAALALVESDPGILGIVYKTDAGQSEAVRVLHEFPPQGAARVTYYGALVEGGDRQALGRRFFDFMAGPTGRRIAERHGFGAPLS